MDHSNNDNEICDTNEVKRLSKTYQLCYELYNTENNYVNILKAIIRIIKEPLRVQTDGYPDEFEIKAMFSCLDPIIDVHEKILHKLKIIVDDWSDDNEIGRVFLDHSQQLLTAYPQYVNFHEKTKEMIDKCIEKYPKFKDFLKTSQSDPQCGRQTLKELLINPIQRLPRVQLLLKNIIDKTDVSKADYKSLKEALNTIIEVNKRINKEKEKTEGQLKLFDMMNDIEGCPPTIISSQRQFIFSCDVKLLIKNDSKDTDVFELIPFENYVFTLLLFNDLILLCKKRTIKRTNSLKASISSHNSGVKKNLKKSYKHIETIDLSSIKCLYYEDSDEFKNSFVIVKYPNHVDRTFPVLPFDIKSSDCNRNKVLTHITDAINDLTPDEVKGKEIQIRYEFKSLANVMDYANRIAQFTSRSKYSLMKTKEKLNRSLSVKRSSLIPSMSLESLQVPSTSLPPSSPSSGRRISRMFSSFLSPMGLPNRNSNRYLTSMTSMTSLNENSDIETDNTFSLPTTPAPRKKKCQTIEQN
ncbi:protein ECT2-like [Oppia nitens]|uniref:protein ECT2-like n=1 Tax=Oppia nitens TaxID=1686743 RepID=UPI0023DA8F27|nr:protein ECT2-like [Oppia nitens]